MEVLNLTYPCEQTLHGERDGVSGRLDELHGALVLGGPHARAVHLQDPITCLLETKNFVNWGWMIGLILIG